MRSITHRLLHASRHARVHHVMAVVAVLVLQACAGAADESAWAQGDRVAVTGMWALDGDSLRAQSARGEVELRLWGIDAPERDQPYADASRKALQAVIAGKTGQAEIVAIDDYQRLVVRLQVDGRSVNEAQLRAGHAWWFRRYARAQASYSEAETAAKTARTGLWQAEAPGAPWTYRERLRAAEQEKQQGQKPGN